MNKTVQVLFDEHEIIVNAIDAARQAKILIGKDDIAYESTVRQLIYFFRRYADKYHHFKEEEILFPEMSKRNELMADGIIKEMLENHEDFRESIAGIEKKLEDKKFIQAQQLLERYTEALLDHIAVENDEVFQVAEAIFTDAELDKMYFRFKDIDKELGETVKNDLKEMADSLRKNLLMAD